ncbi:eg45-like domain containing protein, partial [Quercus suber]
RLLQWFSLMTFLVSLLFNFHTSYGDVGTAGLYSPPYLPTACYGSDAFQFPSSNLFAAAGDGIWANGTACGRLYLVRCITSTSTPYACNQNQTIQIKIVDYIGQAPSANNNTMVLSTTAFGTIANSSTTSSYINIEFQQYETQHSNPNMDERKNQSLLSSSFAKYVKEQYVANNGEIPGGPPVLHSAPSLMGNHEMSAGPGVHGDDQYVSLKKAPVPPSAPIPSTQGP